MKTTLKTENPWRALKKISANPKSNDARCSSLASPVVVAGCPVLSIVKPAFDFVDIGRNFSYTRRNIG